MPTRSIGMGGGLNMGRPLPTLLHRGVDLHHVPARRVEADGVAQSPLLVGRHALDRAAVALEHGLVALEVVDGLGLERDVLDPVARGLGEDHRVVVVLVPALQVDVVVVALDLAQARGPRCSRPRTARDREPAPRRVRDGRSPCDPSWASGISARASRPFQIVQRCAWRRPAPREDGPGSGHQPDIRGYTMAFDGEAFVQELRDELEASGRGSRPGGLGRAGRAGRGHAAGAGRLGPPALLGRHVPHPARPVGAGSPACPTR